MVRGQWILMWQQVTQQSGGAGRAGGCKGSQVRALAPTDVPKACSGGSIRGRDLVLAGRLKSKGWWSSCKQALHSCLLEWVAAHVGDIVGSNAVCNKHGYHCGARKDLQSTGQWKRWV